MLPLLLSILVAGAAEPAASRGASAAIVPPSIERSIVRLVNTAQRPDWRTPWNRGETGRGTGSGFVIEGGRILTNAHVIADSRDLVVLLAGDSTPYPARVVAAGHDCDLALVELVDPSQLKGRPPLSFGEMPKMGDEVAALGYPAGGRWISSTRGVVSRVDVLTSAHSGMAHLAAQTDAAINPGNSGGPVMRNGKVVGVTYQAAGGLENVGYFIPPSIVRHFLEDVAEGDGYEGFPALNVGMSNLDNPAARRRLGMEEGQSGVQVDFVHPASPAAGVLKVNDVVLSMGGEDLANDGTVEWGDQRLQLQVVLDRYHVGQTIPMRVLRGGEEMEIEVPLAATVHEPRSYDRLPRYLVYAGLVFVPLDRDYIETFGGRPDMDILYEWAWKQFEEPERPLPGRVVLLRRLPHDVNADFGANANYIVGRVNGKEVHTLEDLQEALSGNTGQHHVFEFDPFGLVGVLDRQRADAAHAEILTSYAIHADSRL